MLHWRIKPELAASVFGDEPARVGVNARLVEGIDLDAVTVTVFDGNSG